jgi:hypothetical protein
VTPIRWALIAIVLACFVAVFIAICRYRRELEDVKADRDEDATRLDELAADMKEQQLLLQQTITRLPRPTSHPVPQADSYGRHASAA